MFESITSIAEYPFLLRALRASEPPDQTTAPDYEVEAGDTGVEPLPATMKQEETATR